MNRLVIIGNGFDLAHGLPTRYSDFIDDLWSKIAKSPQDYTNLVEMDNQRFSFLEGKIIENYSDFLVSIGYYRSNKQHNYREINFDKNGAYVIEIGKNTKRYFFRFTNYFFETICNISINNWVDVENEYYNILKDCLNKSNNEVITEINKQFIIIKELLEKYLIEKVEEDYVFSKDLVNEFIEIFKNECYEGVGLDIFLNELSKSGEHVINNEFTTFEK